MGAAFFFDELNGYNIRDESGVMVLVGNSTFQNLVTATMGTKSVNSITDLLIDLWGFGYNHGLVPGASEIIDGIRKTFTNLLSP